MKVELTEGLQMLLGKRPLLFIYRLFRGHVIKKSVGVIFGKSETEHHLHVKTFDGALLQLDGNSFFSCNTINNMVFIHTTFFLPVSKRPDMLELFYH